MKKVLKKKKRRKQNSLEKWRRGEEKEKIEGKKESWSIQNSNYETSERKM